VVLDDDPSPRRRRVPQEPTWSLNLNIYVFEWYRLGSWEFLENRHIIYENINTAGVLVLLRIDQDWADCNCNELHNH